MAFTVHLPSCSVGTITDPAADMFAALWEEIRSLTRSSLTFHLGQLAKAMERRQNHSKNDVLAFIDCVLLRAVLREKSSITYEGHVTPFVSMLRHAPIRTILDIKAIAETSMREDSESMSWISTVSTGIPDSILTDAFDVPPNGGP